jgi:predicted HTH transcriptional regulator
LDEYRSEYFRLLEDESGLSDFIELLLESFLFGINKLEIDLNRYHLIDKASVSVLNLSPRQEEIMNIIKDHNYVTLDMIQRRFLKVPGRTLRYDLVRLQKKGFIVKAGITKGVVYRARDTT